MKSPQPAHEDIGDAQNPQEGAEGPGSEMPFIKKTKMEERGKTGLGFLSSGPHPMSPGTSFVQSVVSTSETGLPAPGEPLCRALRWDFRG